MKKALALVMAACLAFSLVACGGNTTSTSTSTASSSVSSTASSEATSATATGGLKTGMAVVSSVKTSDADADTDGQGQVSSTVAAVLVDSEGKIVDCKIDVAQNKIAVKADGTFETEGVTFKSKQELKEAYNMKGASAIGKEWYEQADAFAQYVVGMTADEVKAIAIDTAEGSHGGPADADIAASCTIGVGDMIEAIAQAVENAKELGAQAGDTLGLGVTTEMSHSSTLPADNEGEGLAQADTTYAAVTYGTDGKVTSAVVDCTQAAFNTTEEGVVTAKKEEIVSKQDQKEAYGMKKASAIGKEWYEQADAYAANLVGKTADEVKGIEAGAADLAASCTMGVDAMNEAVIRAMA